MSTPDPAIPHWPRLLAPQAVARGFVRPVLSGPQPISGRPQTVQSDAGALQLRLQGVRVHDLGRRVALLEALLFGRLALGLPVYMPLWNWRRGPRARAGLALFGPSVPHSDGAPFSDGSSYAQGTGDCKVALAAPVRATRIFVDMASVASVEGGDWITLGERAHLVSGAWPVDSVAGRLELQITPGLRSAVAAGDDVEIADPFFRAVLSPAHMQATLSLDLAIVGVIDLDFYEANWNA